MQFLHYPGRSSPIRINLAISLFYFLLPLIIFWPVSLGESTLLPVDILFAFEPFLSHAASHGIARPHSFLFADLILQNYPWRQHIQASLEHGNLPLWNPYLFSGTPFLAKAQHLALYPLSIVYFVFPLWKAYGVFIVLHLGLAGLFAYALARTMGLRRYEAFVTGLCYMLSGFVLAHYVFPTIIASAVWFPLILAAILKMIPARPERSEFPAAWIGIGALALGMLALAGHAEMLYYTLLVSVFFGLWRIVSTWTAGSPGRGVCAMALFAIVGLLLAGIQLAPLYEVLGGNFRAESASLAEVRHWAYSFPQLMAFALPNFFGHPAHWEYTQIFTGESVASDAPVFWGRKNFVEGAVYFGILPLLLVLLAVIGYRPARTPEPDARAVESPAVFMVLLLFSLAFAFGTPLYALIHILPGMEQVHSPFRWMLVATLSLSVLAGYGVRRISGESAASNRIPAGDPKLNPKLTPKVARACVRMGIGALILLLISWAFYPSMAPLFDMLFRTMGRAGQVFPGVDEFYSYQFPGMLSFGVLLVLSGGVLTLSRIPLRLPSFMGWVPLWQVSLVLLVILDLSRFTRDLYPKHDPALLAFRPPVVQFLSEDASIWRMTTFDPADRKTLNANTGWLFGFQDIRGYDSIFSASYERFMEAIGYQDQFPHNRVSPLRTASSLDSPLLDLLNVKYVMTEEFIESPKWHLVYRDDGVRVYENREVMPRAFLLPWSATLIAQDPIVHMRRYDPRQYVLLEQGRHPEGIAGDAPVTPGTHKAAAISHYEDNRVEVEAVVEERAWLVLADSYARGWKAYGENRQTPGTQVELELYPVNGVLRGVVLDPGNWLVSFRYRPVAFFYGAVMSVLGGIGLLLLTVVHFRKKDPLVRKQRLSHA